MYKKIATLFLILFSLSNFYARTPEEAAKIAGCFLMEQGNTECAAKRIQRAIAIDTESATVKLAYTQYQSDLTSPAVYVFNGEDQSGFVLISASENSRTILGYADQGYFDAANIPDNMRMWLKMYAEEIAYASSLSQQTATQSPLHTQYPNIEPLLGETQWGQNKPYNDLCPIVDGQRSVAGCVATALSQIMYKHKYPARGQGNHSYKLRNGTEVSADFSKATYDWDNMLPQYKGSSYTAEQANAVAELMFHVGVACNMQYSSTASGSSSGIALQGLNRYFGYDAGIIPLPKDYIPENQVLEGIASDLKEGRPVYISAYTTNYEGHAFVCDGMQSNGYIHINWGWTGTADGYFSISALDPAQQGTGGSAANLAFTVDVCAYANIRPDEGGTAQSLVTADALTLKSDNAIKRTSEINYELFILSNVGSGFAQGNFVYNIYDQNDQLVHTVTLGKINLGSGYYYQTYPLNGKIASTVPAGDYNLIAGIHDTNNTFQPILIQGKGAVKNAITITQDSIFFHSPKSPKLPDTLAADFTLINGTNIWKMDLYTPAFWQNTSDQEYLIRCQLNTNSTTSVIGSYLLDKKNTSTSNSIHLSQATYAIGNSEESQLYTPTELELTITPDQNGNLRVYYILSANFTRYNGFATIESCTWNQLTDGKCSSYTGSITYDPASALTATTAINISKNKNRDLNMHYLIKGVVSKIPNSTENSLEYEETSCWISNDGDKEGSLYCKNLEWEDMDNELIDTQIQTGDQIAILGLIHNDGSSWIDGTICTHYRPEGIAIENLDVTVDKMDMSVVWESEANYFKVRLYDKNDKRMAENIINQKGIAVTLQTKGKYTFWVRPMQDNKQDYAGPAQEIQFTIDGKPATSDVTYTDSPIEVAIYDILGNLILTSHSTTEALQTLKSGVYILVSDQSKKIIYRQ